MMRLNATILALAALSLLPASALARPVHAHKTAARRTVSAPAKKTSPTATAKTVRASAVSASQAHTKRGNAAVRHEATVRHEETRTKHVSATPKYHRATSEHFVRASAPKPSKAATASAAAKPEPVVNVIRRNSTQHPQLEDVDEEAATPMILPALYNKRGHLIVPPPLKGSHEILVHQNLVADNEGLDRIKDDDDLERMRAQHLLVALPESKALDVDDRLPTNRRYCRPWTAQFLAALSRAHYARFHTSLQVNSAVRTVEFQQRLQRTNGNAAPAEGETASPHLTGQAVDLAKHGLSMTEIAWLRGYLLPLVHEGKIDVEEEFQQSCFHISVYKRYLPSTPTQRVAGTRHGGTASLAAAIE